MAEEIKDAQVVEESTEEQPIEINVPSEVAVQMKIMEFDRMIADGESQIAKLKKDKMDFLYQSNVQAIQAKYQNTDDSTEEKPVEEAE